MGVADVTGRYWVGGAVTAAVPGDRVALGFYNIDIHPIAGCSYDPSILTNTSLPFFIPLRALTSSASHNLLVSGRALAQDFYTASATRTHVTEFHTGVAAMIAALFCWEKKVWVWDVVGNDTLVGELQGRIRRVMPLEWTINGSLHPGNTSID
jgi:hypothetical protein